MARAGAWRERGHGESGGMAKAGARQERERGDKNLRGGFVGFALGFGCWLVFLVLRFGGY